MHSGTHQQTILKDIHQRRYLSYSIHTYPTDRHPHMFYWANIRRILRDTHTYISYLDWWYCRTHTAHRNRRPCIFSSSNRHRMHSGISTCTSSLDSTRTMWQKDRPNSILNCSHNSRAIQDIGQHKGQSNCQHRLKQSMLMCMNEYCYPHTRLANICGRMSESLVSSTCLGSDLWMLGNQRRICDLA